MQFFKNGRDAARAIGCSHVLVYRVASGDDYPCSANGWKLQWVPRSAPGAEKLLQRAQRECEAMEAKRAEKRMNAAKKKKAERAKAREEKAAARLKKKLERVDGRIEVWQSHLSAFDSSASGRRSAYLAKIERLKRERQDLLSKLGEGK